MRRRRRGTLETVATGLVGRWTSLSEGGWLQGMLSRMVQLLYMAYAGFIRWEDQSTRRDTHPSTRTIRSAIRK